MVATSTAVSKSFWMLMQGSYPLRSVVAPMHLRIAQVVASTEAEGPGRRFALWVQGCPIRCPGCCNPEMFSATLGTRVSVDELVRQVTGAPAIEGVSLLGGEPFAQAEACASFARRVRALGLSVMVFTGYTRGELEARRQEAGVGELLQACDLLVDGRFEQDLPERSRRWIGSTNQVLHFLTPRYEPTDPRFVASNTAEIRLTRDSLMLNGWPPLLPALRRSARGAY
jgi:anaerobic ribonucleoside-triphosphate reductase activating protein